jgi:hypothetical protein
MKFVTGKKDIKSKFVRKPTRPMSCIGHRRSISTPKNSLGRVKAQSRAPDCLLFDGLIKKMKITSEIDAKETVLIKNPKSLRRSFN